MRAFRLQRERLLVVLDYLDVATSVCGLKLLVYEA
jgi:hypothetical protein